MRINSKMVKNAPSNPNLRGSATLPLRPSQPSSTVPASTNPVPKAPLSTSAQLLPRLTSISNPAPTTMQAEEGTGSAGALPSMEAMQSDSEAWKMCYTREDGAKGYRTMGPTDVGGFAPAGSARGPGRQADGFIPGPPSASTLFSGYRTVEERLRDVMKAADKDELEYSAPTLASPFYQSYPVQYPSQADDQARSGHAGPTNFTLAANTAEEKSFYAKYLEEMAEATKNYKESLKKEPLNANILPTLTAKYKENVTEALKKYENGKIAQLAASCRGHLAVGESQSYDTPISSEPSQNPRYPPPQAHPTLYEQFPAANEQHKTHLPINSTLGQRDFVPEFLERRQATFEDHSLSGSHFNSKPRTEGVSGRGTSLITQGLEQQNALKSPEAYTQPFCEFLSENPTVWHAVRYFEKKLDAAGFKKLSERQTWNSTLEKSGKYYITRNGSSLIAFTVGSNYKSGNGVAMVAGHVDALAARLKPVSSKTTKAGYVQLGVAPYAGALNSTWWDRDLGIGGRVLVKDEKTGKIETKLVKLGWPIARIPTLAPHFGVGMTGSNNAETEAVPIIGLDSTSSTTSEFENLTLGGADSFAATQPPKLVRAIAGELSIQDFSSIVNWELELYDTQPAQVGGLDKEFIFGGRIDDKLCSWAAIEALLASASATSTSTGGGTDDGIVRLVGVFDDEEIGSLLRQGARGNFLPSTIERIVESFGPSSPANTLSQTYANSFLVSADVTHAVNPNFVSRYLENHAPRLNVGLVVCADSNGHMTTDSVSTALLTRIAEKSGSELQLFMIRNDSRSGGTVGPMLSSAMGVRAIDAGIPQLSMHSIRATTGSLDPGLGVKIFAGFFEHFQGVDAEFE